MHKIKNILSVSLTLAKINFRLRTENSYLGILWYLLNPLLLFIILYFVRQSAFQGNEIEYFSLYLLIGITCYNFFKLSLTESINSVVDNPNYIKSINKVHPHSLVIAVIIQALYSHLFELILITILVFYFGINPIGLLFYIPAILLFSILTSGIGMIFATTGVFINDLKNIWIILSQILLLGTPIFYTLNTNSFLYKINLFNPLFYFIETSRSLLIYNKMPSFEIILGLILFTCIFFVVGLTIFNKYRYKFAEYL